ncbi:HAAS signaling domain-containing protein [Microbacterium murale]|uniref:DUF1700 domain-containing protein n=1 Tax=Microbacterium murale TaxID=1081040 RepID=A0ABQ1R9X4_9MICO|nr:hypothetical protein [Microbacterium murale]GGD61434.1 hypothetical protein GCM10007269_00720 [Microbacterium murale]
MTEPHAESLRRDFLERLDAAMTDLPHGVATEIHGGIEEELDGLDAEATAARIAQLGDPDTIAREARAEVPAGPLIAAAAPERSARPTAKMPLVDTRGYAITSALVFAFGGFVVPVVGWFVGAVLVSSSTLWRRWEKVVAIVLPFAVAAVIALVIWIGSLLPSAGTSGGQMSGLGWWHSSILFVFILIPAIGAWLLWRLRRRGPGR